MIALLLGELPNQALRVAAGKDARKSTHGEIQAKAEVFAAQLGQRALECQEKAPQCFDVMSLDEVADNGRWIGVRPANEVQEAL